MNMEENFKKVQENCHKFDSQDWMMEYIKLYNAYLDEKLKNKQSKQETLSLYTNYLKEL